MAQVVNLGTESISETERLLWVDCEFTGLEPAEGHKILEIGVLVTDLFLREQEEYHAFIKQGWMDVDNLMLKNPWWKDRQADKNRIKEGIQTGIERGSVDRDLSNIVATHFGVEKPPLCGNSLAHDRKHIESQFPEFANAVHYRSLDVSTLKLIAKKYYRTEYGDKKNKHYAIDDIRESIDELRFLMKALHIADLSTIANNN